jgi:hypothetical protein
MKIKQAFAAFALAVVVFGIVPFSEAKAVTMSPVRIELSADPGDHTDGVVKIFNDEKITRTLYLSVVKFESKDESGDPQFVQGDTSGLPSWMHLQSSVVIPPLEYREIPYSIDVPNGTDPGGYFAAIFASVIPPTPGESAVALQSDVGTLILFRVNGTFPEGETILEFATKDKKYIYNHLPIEFFFRFQNSGKDRAMPLGDITITNMFGEISKVVSGNRGAGNVLPESIRRFDSAWVTAGGEKGETYQGDIKQPEFKTFFDAVKYQWNNFALGRYNANLRLTVNNDASRAYSKSVAFWIIPWQLLLVALAIFVLFVLPLVALFTVILIYFRRRKRRKNSPPTF